MTSHESLEQITFELECADVHGIKQHLPKPKGNVCKVISVYDGDTITIAAKFDDAICKHSVRLMGLDCPEMRGRGPREKEVATLIRDYVRSLCMNKICKIDVKGTDKYGRYMASIYLPSEIELGSRILSLGLARPYSGDNRNPFSEEELDSIENKIKQLFSDDCNRPQI